MRSLSFASLALVLAGCATRPPLPPAAAFPAAPIEVQILAINDFHGNLETPERPVKVTLVEGSTEQRMGGAAALAATIKRLEAGAPPSAIGSTSPRSTSPSEL